MEKVMKGLASTLSRQRGIQYEFGPEFDEYTAQKAAGILKDTHLKPLSEMFTEDELQGIPVDNKVGENYLGYFSEHSVSSCGEKEVLHIKLLETGLY